VACTIPCCPRLKIAVPSCAQSTYGDERPCRRSNYGDIVPDVLVADRRNLMEMRYGTQANPVPIAEGPDHRNDGECANQDWRSY
jgi:hypothetical protein